MILLALIAAIVTAGISVAMRMSVRREALGDEVSERRAVALQEYLGFFSGSYCFSSASPQFFARLACDSIGHA